ncbi:MAG TPA: hypothetical protein VE076_05480 [Nitrososphaeraceae archaeon]|nr:hypothetical protein [Nitrososphaeraceae archaeon]
MQTKTKTIALFAIVAATLAFVAVAPSLINSASAAIKPGGCTNRQGTDVGPTCPGNSANPGQGHTQRCNSNPQGSCPPGQNP